MSLLLRDLPRPLRAGTIVVLTVLVLGAEAAPATAKAKPGREAQIARLVNRARMDRHVRPLRHCADLHRIARKWSRRMARTSNLAHNPSLTAQASPYWALAENVAYASTARAAQRNLMGSAAHRANMLSGTYRQVGIGVYRRGDRAWVTQIFRKPAGGRCAKVRGRSRGHGSP